MLSHTSSTVDADDERSSTDGDMSSSLGSGNDEEVGNNMSWSGIPTYKGHDTRPTSRKELAGWYMYGFASETYMICGIGMMLDDLL